MKNIFLTIGLVFLSFHVYSQDLIVTNEGDSLNCKITKIKHNNIYFTFKHKDEIRNTLLPVSSIKVYKIDCSSKSEVPKEKIIGHGNYQHVRIGLNAGYSYQFAKVSKRVPDELKDYVKGLKSGYHFGADLTYFFSEPLGFGFKCFAFRSSNSKDDLLIPEPTGYRNLKMSDDLKISFIGPMFSTRLLNFEKKNALLTNLAIGYMGYTDNIVFVDKYKITGNTVGFAFEIGYDIGLSENISLGLQISMITGALSKFDLHKGDITQTIKLDKEEHESLNRFDFSIGLRFGK